LSEGTVDLGPSAVLEARAIAEPLVVSEEWEEPEEPEVSLTEEVSSDLPTQVWTSALQRRAEMSRLLREQGGVLATAVPVALEIVGQELLAERAALLASAALHIQEVS
jgi:hypothetical protein